MTADIGADERRIRHLLIKQGVGPDALHEPEPAPTPSPVEDLPFGLFDLPDTIEAPAPAPAPEPEPEAAVDEDQEHDDAPQAPRRPWTSRLPNWRKGETADLSKPAAEEDDEPAAEAEAEDEPVALGKDTEPASDEIAPEAEQPREQPGPRRWRPRRSAAAPGESARPAVRMPNSRLRIIAFNGTAAGAGYALGLVPLLGRYLPDAETSVFGTVGLLLAAGSGFVGWKAASSQVFTKVVPYEKAVRLVVTVAAAEFGRRLAPVPIMWLNEHGAPYGLGPATVSLLLTGLGVCGGLWWLLDRPARRWSWVARWVVRVPLASALLATALYAPGH